MFLSTREISLFTMDSQKKDKFVFYNYRTVWGMSYQLFFHNFRHLFLTTLAQRAELTDFFSFCYDRKTIMWKN